uniref:Uncharacterized protein n=1 Tax=Triticum urartu TaxID=4572 RepID=A0A8R7QC66_TRIUA
MTATTSPAPTPPSPSTPTTPPLQPTPTASRLVHQAYLLSRRSGKSPDPGEIRRWTSSRVCSSAPSGDAVQLQIRWRSMASLRAQPKTVVEVGFAGDAPSTTHGVQAGSTSRRLSPPSASSFTRGILLDPCSRLHGCARACSTLT